MKYTNAWTHPISVPEIAHPRTEILGDNLYIVADGKSSLARYFGTDETFVLPETIQENIVVAVSTGAFSNATELRSVSISGAVRTVGDYAFFHCTRLADVCISSELRGIGDFAFAGCKNLESIYIPATVTHIGDNAFKGCGNLVIQGEAGSVAHRYADAHGFFFMTAAGPSAA